MKRNMLAIACVVLLPAYSSATPRFLPNPTTTGVVVMQPPAAKRIKPHRKVLPPIKPRWHDDIKHHTHTVEAIKFVGDGKTKTVAECSIMKAPDPDDDMAFMLWSAYIDSPRHATRTAWEKFDSQYVFHRMAQAALSICGNSITSSK